MGRPAKVVRTLRASDLAHIREAAAHYVEYEIAGAAALKLGRPVKWTETRTENMLSMVHGRSFIMDAKLGVMNDGSIVGLHARLCVNDADLCTPTRFQRAPAMGTIEHQMNRCAGSLGNQAGHSHQSGPKVARTNRGPPPFRYVVRVDEHQHIGRAKQSRRRLRRVVEYARR